MKRFQARRTNGRFQRNTLANTFGLKAPICAACNSFNPHGIDEPPPAMCHFCGKPLVDKFDALAHHTATSEQRKETPDGR